MNYVPEQGDIVWLDFDPSAGQEITKRRTGLVLSRHQFNNHTGFAIVAPITNTIRGMTIEVLLPEGFQVTGAVLVYQMRSLDYIERKATFIAKAPATVLAQALKYAQLLVA